MNALYKIYIKLSVACYADISFEMTFFSYPYMIQLPREWILFDLKIINNIS